MRFPLPWHRPKPPSNAAVPALAAGGARARRLRSGIHLRRLGGVPVATPAGVLPRLRGIAAIRGFCLTRRPVEQVELLVDGRVVRISTTVPGDTADARRKAVFNIWHDFADVPPGIHRVTVRPRGALGRWAGRSRRVLVEAAPDDPPASDAFVPHGPGDPETVVAALPSEVRSAARAVLPEPVRTILLVRADQLGDVAVSVPAVAHVRRLFPEARLVGLVTAAGADLARATGLFDELVVADFSGADGRRVLDASAQEALRQTLAAHRFDLAVDLGEGAQSRLLLLLSGAKFLFGFRHGDHPWLSAAFELNGRDPDNALEVLPPARKLLALTDALGRMRHQPATMLPAPSADLPLLAKYGLRPGERWAVLHTGARFAPSRWPGFPALAQALLDRTDLDLLVFVDEAWDGPRHPRLRVVAGHLPFPEFDALIGHAALFVGNDSGPKHLAALRGTPVVSLHMARLNWNEWGQEGDGLIVSRRVPCAGCNVGDQPDECGRGYTCIRAIEPEEVFAAAMQLL